MIAPSLLLAALTSAAPEAERPAPPPEGPGGDPDIAADSLPADPGDPADVARRGSRALDKRDPDVAPPRTADDPPPTALGGADRVEGEELANVVAFTFDDGPDPYTTPRVLDALARYRVPAAFFIVNRHIVGHRGKAGLPVLARIVADGHLIGGHTANHARLRTLEGDQLLLELDDSIGVLGRAAGVPVELFRPPYGSLGLVAGKRVRRLGLTDVRWSIDPRDLESADEDELRQAVLAGINRDRGGIVLLHDTKRITAGALARLLGDLERDNCKRLARGTQPILPVSLHYFLRDEGVPRPVPPEVAARTEQYLRYLADVCHGKKPRPAPAGSSAAPAEAGVATTPEGAPRQQARRTP
jgi:peptidoglycan/xylan/chitin deacetylase (PgdA/CDA1 family)